MKFVISRNELAVMIGKIQGVVPARPPIPILSNILVEAGSNHIVMSATDLTVSVRAYSDAKVLQEGAITLPARRFFQLIREINSPQVEIESDEKGNAKIIAGTSEFRLHGMNRSDFPVLPDLNEQSGFELPASDFKDMLSKTAFAAAKDDSRQVLNGVYVQIQSGEVSIVGTDGKRLAKVSKEVDIPISERWNFIIPLKAVEEMIRMLDVEDTAKFTIMQDKVALEVGSICLITKLLSGQYPDVERVIPDQSAMKLITLHKDELTSLLKQVSLFTSEMNYSVRFVFDQGDLKLQAVSSDIGEGKVNMPVDYSENKLEIAFNPYFFIDILRHCKDETATFGVTDSFNPGMITDSSNATFVIMPMRLSHD